MREALLCVTVALLGASLARAADSPPFAEGRDDSDQYVVETVANGLDHPTSIAVRPAAQGEERFDFFISETGARRVLKWSTDRAHDPRPIITNFPAGEAPDEVKPTGPWGLDFLSRNRLAVGSGGLRGVVRVYSLPDDEAELDYEAVDHAVGPVEHNDESAEPDGFFMSMAHAESAVFVVARDGDSRGGILKATLDANRLAGLEAFAAAPDASDARNPGAVAVDPRPNHHYVVVAQGGENQQEPDSRLTMYSPASGKVAITVAVGLRDIVALAFSPSADLYAADSGSGHAETGGVYRLEAAQVEGRESCQAVKIAAIANPSSLTFTPDGVLYVTSAGDGDSATDAADAKHGSLLQIKPKDNVPPL